MPFAKKVRGGDAKALSNGQSSRRESSRETGISLPTKPNVPPKNFSDYCLFFYGDKGVGKSSLASQFPDPIHLMMEPRRRNLPIRQVPQQGEPPLSWSRLRKYVDLILKDKPQTCIFDTADKAWSLCNRYICDKRGINAPGDLKGYAGSQVWFDIRQEFEEVINDLLQANITLVFISHARWREGDTVSGDTFECVCPTLSDAPWNVLKSITDYAFYYGYKGQKRVIYLRGSSRIWASCGTSEDHFLQPKTREPLLWIPTGTTPKEAYKALCDSFNNKVQGELYLPEDETETDAPEDEDVALPKRKR